MESEQQALLRTMRAQPDDTAPRLIYADWLDEHDEHDIAEFIRVSVSLRELRQVARTSKEYMDVAQIETTLRYALQSRFTCGTAYLTHTHGLFNRAVVYRDQLRAFVPYLPNLVAMFPLVRLEIMGTRVAALQPLLERPELLTISELALRMECDDITSIARCLTACPHLDNLQQLELLEYYTLVGNRRLDFPNDLQVVNAVEREQLRKRFGAALVWREPNARD